MDRLANWTNGLNETASITVPGENCTSDSSPTSFLDKTFVVTPSPLSVTQELKWIFLLHTYGFACLFFVLAFYTFLSILHLRSLISSRPFMSTINIFLCLLGLSRAVSLFIDAYNLKRLMPRMIGALVWDIGFPCVTSAFCLVQLAFLQLTQLKFGPEKLQKESCLSLIITGHFFLVIASDIVLISHNCYMAKYMVQTVFVIWSILLYLMFLHAGYKIRHLLRTVPNSMLTRDNSVTHQKGIMQLAMLAPYNELASFIAAALVPTLLGPKSKPPELHDTVDFSKEPDQEIKTHTIDINTQDSGFKDPIVGKKSEYEEEEKYIPPPPVPVSTVPEVYVRPPTPTPSPANLPIITVSSPSRRSSAASSRRGSDVSARSSRRSSEVNVRFNNDENASPRSERRRNTEFSPRCSPDIDRMKSRSPDRMSRRHSENITPTGSTKDVRRCSDFTHEKSRGSQFATKLRRNSDFGNRTPKRMLPTEEQPKLPRVLDLSPAGSRRSSDVTGLSSPRSESRRNSDITLRRKSDLGNIKPLLIDRRTSDVSIRTLDKSPTRYQCIVPEKTELLEKSESDSDQPDCNEKAALMNEKNKQKDDEAKARKKNLSWKHEKDESEEITAETNLIPQDSTSPGRATVKLAPANQDSNTEPILLGGTLQDANFTLHSILNHIAYVNRAKTDTPLHILETNTAVVRRSQIKRVINVTYTTAILGIILCVADVMQIIGPYGLLAESVKYGTRPTQEQYPKPWPWLIYQTLCRGLEFVMGCAIASITKQPSVGTVLHDRLASIIRQSKQTYTSMKGLTDYLFRELGDSR